jgi:hypothetical protein
VRPAPAPPRAVAAAITASTTAPPAAKLAAAARRLRHAVGSRRDRATTTCRLAPSAPRGTCHIARTPSHNPMHSFSSCIPTFDHLFRSSASRGGQPPSPFGFGRTVNNSEAAALTSALSVLSPAARRVLGVSSLGVRPPALSI